MARIKFLLAFLALLVCVGGVGGAWYFWEKFAQPELVVNRHISGKGEGSLGRPDLGQRHFDAAVALLREGELVSARDRLLYLMRYFPESATIPEAKRIAGEVNMDLLLSRIPLPGKTEHVVRRGEALLTIAGRSRTTIDYIMRANGKTTELIYPDEALVVYPLDFRVEISLAKGTATVYDGEDFFKEYAILDRNLPADVRPPVSTTVSERVAWFGSQPVNFTQPSYMSSAKWLRTGRIGLFLRQVDPGEAGGGEGRPFGIMLANPDLEELFTILRVGSKVDLVK
jgi:hypothetical protein